VNASRTESSIENSFVLHSCHGFEAFWAGDRCVLGGFELGWRYRQLGLFHSCHEFEASIDVFWAGELGWRVSTTRTIFVLVISSRRRKVRVVDISITRQLDNSNERHRSTAVGAYKVIYEPQFSDVIEWMRSG
jgi:hypothetical protein